ncbi:hypothetical protein PIB30_028608, partial [Stylosanthes scabra]|nr:hypothetical protein [Stylosanthes scabra]
MYRRGKRVKRGSRRDNGAGEGKSCRHRREQREGIKERENQKEKERRGLSEASSATVACRHRTVWRRSSRCLRKARLREASSSRKALESFARRVQETPNDIVSSAMKPFSRRRLVYKNYMDSTFFSPPSFTYSLPVFSLSSTTSLFTSSNDDTIKDVE